MSKNKICVACGFEDFEDNINNFCCNCGKDIDTGLTLEEMDKQGINYIIDRRTEHKNYITKNNDINYMHIIDFEDYLKAETQARKDEIAKGFYDCLQGTTKINCDFIKENNQLKAELAEKDKLLENAIVPKFKIGDEVWIIKRIKQEVANGKIIKKYLYFNSGTPENLRNVNRWRIRLKNNSEVTKKEYEIFDTKEEAKEALKKLEEK